MNGDTQIIVSGREYKVPGPTVSYEADRQDLERASQVRRNTHSSASQASTTTTT